MEYEYLAKIWTIFANDVSKNYFCLLLNIFNVYNVRSILRIKARILRLLTADSWFEMPD